MKIVVLVLALLLEAVAAPTAGFSVGKASGFPNAPIMIEVFSDFQCPLCKTLHDEALRSLMKDYVGNGKVYLIHRNFPLTQHAYSRQAALYATAAERIGKYQQVADALYANQAAWSASGKVDETACSVLTPAEAKQVRALVATPATVASVEQDLALGKKVRLDATPTMIVTYRLKQYPLVGAVNYNLLKSFLDDLLAK
jgi:protein-disulfide isomerase